MLKPEITAEKVQQLREISGFGLMDCRAALKQADGNIDKAIEILRKKQCINILKN